MKAEIVDYFHDELDIELKVFDGGAQRTNLEFVVVPTSSGEKFEHIHQILDADLPTDESGGAIVYCATRRQTEELATLRRGVESRAIPRTFLETKKAQPYGQTGAATAFKRWPPCGPAVHA